MTPVEVSLLATEVSQEELAAYLRSRGGPAPPHRLAARWPRGLRVGPPMPPGLRWRSDMLACVDECAAVVLDWLASAEPVSYTWLDVDAVLRLGLGWRYSRPGRICTVMSALRDLGVAAYLRRGTRCWVVDPAAVQRACMVRASG